MFELADELAKMYVPKSNGNQVTQISNNEKKVVSKGLNRYKSVIGAKKDTMCTLCVERGYDFHGENGFKCHWGKAHKVKILLI